MTRARTQRSATVYIDTAGIEQSISPPVTVRQARTAADNFQRAAAIAATASISQILIQLFQTHHHLPLSSIAGNRYRPRAEYSAWLRKGTRRGQIGLARLRCAYECLAMMQLAVGRPDMQASWMAASWLTNPQEALSGRVPCDLLRKGELEMVRQACQTRVRRLYRGGIAARDTASHRR